MILGTCGCLVIAICWWEKDYSRNREHGNKTRVEWIQAQDKCWWGYCKKMFDPSMISLRNPQGYNKLRLEKGGKTGDDSIKSSVHCDLGIECESQQGPCFS